MIRTCVEVLSGFVLGVLTARLATKPHRTVIHMRGSIPGEFKGQYCQECRHRPANFIDQDTRAWCAYHLPRNTRYAERAVAKGNGHSDAECTVHGLDCPKAWSYVFK